MEAESTKDILERIVRDALVGGNKVQYPMTVYLPYRSVELLDFMNEFKECNEDLDIVFMRDNDQGYWRLK